MKTLDPTPTAVVAAAATWAEFPTMWGPMLDKVWSFLRGGAPKGLYTRGHNIMLYKDDVPNVEVGVQVSGSFAPAGDVVASALPGGLAATATHTGPIAKLGDTHQAVREWSTAGGHLAVYSSLIKTFRPDGGGGRQADSMIVGHPRRISPILTHDHPRCPVRYPDRVSGGGPRRTPVVQFL